MAKTKKEIQEQNSEEKQDGITAGRPIRNCTQMGARLRA